MTAGERVYVITGSHAQYRAWLIDRRHRVDDPGYAYVRNEVDLQGRRGLHYILGYGAEARRDWAVLKGMLESLDAVDDAAGPLAEYAAFIATLADCTADCPDDIHVHPGGDIALPIMATIKPLESRTKEAP